MIHSWYPNNTIVLATRGEVHLSVNSKPKCGYDKKPLVKMTLIQAKVWLNAQFCTKCWGKLNNL